MEAILLEKIRNLGNLGDQVTVKPGFARNYLFPQGKAVPNTKENAAKFEASRAELEKKAAESLKAAQDRVDALKALMQVKLSARVGEEGKLYGSINNRDVAEAIVKAGMTVNKSEVHLEHGVIRQIGEHKVTLVLHPEVTTELTVLVEAE